jgi:hypothetical protein
MGNDSNRSGVLRTAVGESSFANAHVRHALPGEWVRPFGDKVTALQRRRRNTEAARRAANDAAHGEVALCTTDGTVAFHLRSSELGLLIERLQHRPTGTVLGQSMLLADVRAFLRWCDVEPLRFDDPVLYDRLRRQGDGLLSKPR